MSDDPRCAFAAAAAEHRFEDVSDDLGVRVMFRGPEGGEASC